MSLKVKHHRGVAPETEKSDNPVDTDWLILEIEKNRIEMQLAWHKAAMVNFPIQVSDQPHDNPQPPQSPRRKKSR